MKLTSLLILLFLGLLNKNIYAGSGKVYADAALGDVVFSYLDETSFKLVHSNDWIQLNGNANIHGTELCDLIAKQGINCQLNNFMGKFIRVYGGNSGAVGTVQNYSTARPTNTEFTLTTDSSGNHNHSFSYNGGFGSSGATVGGSHMLNNNNKATTDSGAHSHTGRVNGGGDTETRPENISLYAYIRVNTNHSQSKETEVIQEKLEFALQELKNLKRRECPSIKTSHRDSLVSCYVGIVRDFIGGTYLMADGEMSRVVRNVNKIICQDEKYINENESNLLQTFMTKYGSSDFNCL